MAIMASRSFAFQPHAECTYPHSFVEQCGVPAPATNISHPATMNESTAPLIVPIDTSGAMHAKRPITSVDSRTDESSKPDRENLGDRDSEEGEMEGAEDDEDEHFALIPFIDLLNHSNNGFHNFAYEPQTREFVFRVGQSCPAGAQLFLRYNGMDHWKFAKYYGFVPAEYGVFDAFPVSVVPPSAFAESVADITRAQIFTDKRVCKRCYITGVGPNMKLVGALRLRYLTEEELPSLAKAFKKEYLSVRNEWHVYSAIQKSTTLQSQ